jgi:hypothetical protein
MEMLNDQEQKSFKEALCSYLGKYDAARELRILQISEMSFEHVSSDFGIDYYILRLKISPIEYVEYADDIHNIQSNLTNSSKLFLKDFGAASLSQVLVSPKFSGPISKRSIPQREKSRIIKMLDDARSILIGVATGGPRIQEKNDEYISIKDKLNEEFQALGHTDIGLFTDLWAWYGIWSSGPYPTYQSRRVYISELIDGLARKIDEIESDELQEVDLTGSQRLDRAIREIRFRYSEANTEEQYQAVGVLCRESLITLAQMVFDPEKHIKYCDKTPSSTDTKRMLDAFLQDELPGATNKTLRRYAKSANDLANELTHRRTATEKDAVICVNASFSVIKIVYALLNKVDSTSI